MTCNICTNYLYFSCFSICDMFSDSDHYYNIFVLLFFPTNTDFLHYLDFFVSACQWSWTYCINCYNLNCILTGLGLWIQDSPDHLLLGVSCSERQKAGVKGPKPKANSTDLSGSQWQTRFFCWLKRMDWFSWSLLMCGSNLWGKFVCYFRLFSFVPVPKRLLAAGVNITT